MPKLSEFELIEKYFAPLAAPNGNATGKSFGLLDDAAVLSCAPGEEWVVTKDAIVEGIHFLSDDPPASVAKKLLRVNLSDLAAKGAKPSHYLLAAAWPTSAEDAWVAEFARGLAEDQELFGVGLLGGDTVSTHGPATFSLTAFGTVKAGNMIRRAGAQVGDKIYVSGTIGDAILGLQILKEGLSVTADGDRDFLVNRYRVPQPRLDLLDLLQQNAHAAIDVSDGLLADLDHLCRASHLGAHLNLASIPLSSAARSCIDAETAVLEDLVRGGDDYEVLFAASPTLRLPNDVTPIGVVIEKEGLWVGTDDGPLSPLDPAGFRHF